MNKDKARRLMLISDKLLTHDLAEARKRLVDYRDSVKFKAWHRNYLIQEHKMVKYIKTLEFEANRRGLI